MIKSAEPNHSDGGSGKGRLLLNWMAIISLYLVQHLSHYLWKLF